MIFSLRERDVWGSVCGIIGASSIQSWLDCEAGYTFDTSERRLPSSCDSPDASVKCNSDFLETPKFISDGNCSIAEQMRLGWVGVQTSYTFFVNLYAVHFSLPFNAV